MGTFVWAIHWQFGKAKKINKLIFTYSDAVIIAAQSFISICVSSIGFFTLHLHTACLLIRAKILLRHKYILNYFTALMKMTLSPLKLPD